MQVSPTASKAKPSLSAIQTAYKGYRFRSRLEARWAVFFDHLGLSWVYEPEGFILPDGTRYLPDFLVTSPTGIKHWYEVKPEGVAEDSKFSKFSGATRSAESPITYTQLLSGDPLSWFGPHLRQVGALGGMCPRCGGITSKFYDEVHDFGFEIGIGCEPCDMDTPFGGGHGAEKGVLCNLTPHKGVLLVDYRDWQTARTRIRIAANKARSARFEHGARGSF